MFAKHKTKVAVSLIIFFFISGIAVSTSVYFRGLRRGYNQAVEDLKTPYFENWVFFQNESITKNIFPSIGFELNFSNDITDLEINTSIMIWEPSEIYYLMNIYATSGNLTEFGFKIFFNDAVYIIYRKRTTRYYEDVYNTNEGLPLLVNREDYPEGIFYPRSYINFVGFEDVKLIKITMIVISEVNVYY